MSNLNSAISLSKIFLVSIFVHLVLLPILGLFTCTVGLMGMEFEKLKKKKIPTDRPIPEKQGRVRGNKTIFKVGPGWKPGRQIFTK